MCTSPLWPSYGVKSRIRAWRTLDTDSLVRLNAWKSPPLLNIAPIKTHPDPGSAEPSPTFSTNVQHRDFFTEVNTPDSSDYQLSSPCCSCKNHSIRPNCGCRIWDQQAWGKVAPFFQRGIAGYMFVETSDNFARHSSNCIAFVTAYLWLPDYPTHESIAWIKGYLRKHYRFIYCSRNKSSLGFAGTSRRKSIRVLCWSKQNSDSAVDTSALHNIWWRYVWSVNLQPRST